MMGKVNTFITPGGDKMAVLPLEDYEELLESADNSADVRVYDASRRRRGAGEDEAVPVGFAKRLIAGENPVRVWRELRGLPAKELAAKSGIKGPCLRQIETCKREGTFRVMARIADALGATLDDLSSAPFSAD
jgi:ribosome-binding protein aMBF1 (putative translation factor)